MKLLALFLVFATLSCSIVGRPSFPAENVELLRKDGSTIDFYLQPSAQKNKANTLVLYLQGSDCNSVLKDPFLEHHAKSVWPTADWLLIEKRGITADLAHSFNAERPDCPSEYIEHDNPHQRVKDIQQVVAHVLRKRTYQNVIAVGGSEGAVIAAMYAALNEHLSAAVLINGGGRHFLNDVLHNIRLTAPAEALEEQLNGFNGFAAHILAADPFDIQVSNHGYGWWKTMLALDQQTVLGAITIPTLIIQGGRDQSVSPTGVTEMIESLRGEGKTHFDFVVYPDLDHGLMNSVDVSMADTVIQDVNRWLRDHIGR